MQRSALDLAVEQAVLRKNIADSFVNLGRRNQELLDRQLDLITDLERRADDPDRLEGLFRLDHLATRMRRNAESLLRLAGGDEVLQGDWGAPVPVVDVIRGALGEVEGYQRVEVMSLDSALIDGSAGADIAHAVAELVENALTFSPPQENVKIRGRRRGDGYVIAVMDQGVGMSEEQLTVANRRLAGQESFTVAPSRYLGHYVAGHLASTHRVRISLQQETLGGITARIDIPSSILIDDTGMVPVQAQQPAADTPVDLEPDAGEADPGRRHRGPRPGARGHRSPGRARARARADAAPALMTFEQEVRAAVDAPALAQRTDREPVMVPDDTPLPQLGAEAGLPHANFTRSEVTGLTRRIRGANAPRATNVADAFGGGAAPREVQRASADDVASFLAAFEGGVSRGLAESDGDSSN